MIAYPLLPLLTSILLATSAIARPAADPQPGHPAGFKQTSRDEVLRRALARSLKPHRRDSPSGTSYASCSSGTVNGTPAGAIFTNTGWRCQDETRISSTSGATTDNACAQKCLDYSGTTNCNIAWTDDGDSCAIDYCSGINLFDQDGVDTFIRGMDCATASATYDTTNTCCNYYPAAP